MLIYDDIISWRANGESDSNCRLQIIKLGGAGVAWLKNYYIVVSDLGNGSGTSITNSAAFLIPYVCRAHDIDVSKMVWFEHYPHKGSDFAPTLDVVVPGLSNSCCGSECANMISIAWRPARPNEIKHVQQFLPDIM